MRLDKFISHVLNVTRANAIDVIKDGKVEVNGKVVKKKDFFINEEIDKISYLDKLIKYRKFIYFMLNKPQGVVSAVRDKKDKTVIDLIVERKDIFPVGRLDKDTEGLLILTNNGSLAHKLTSPKYDCIKKYYVESIKDFTKEEMISFCQGLVITDQNNELFLTKKANIEYISERKYFVYITEGKFHQIKKMFIALDNEVVFLKRVSHGSISLDNSLLPGQYRELTDEEVILLKEMYNE